MQPFNVSEGDALTSGVLFDLDGTLLDSAPDYVAALNTLLHEQGLPPVDFVQARQLVSRGAWALLKLGLGREPHREQDLPLRIRMLDVYRGRLTLESRLFPGVEQLLQTLDERGIPWGIVTNKPGFLTAPLLDHFGFTARSKCSIAGDTLAMAKPDPEPILHACREMGIDPQSSIMVGDAEPDIRAGQAAGTRTVLCRYGYLPDREDWRSWKPDLVVDAIGELLPHLPTSS